MHHALSYLVHGLALVVATQPAFGSGPRTAAGVLGLDARPGHGPCSHVQQAAVKKRLKRETEWPSDARDPSTPRTPTAGRQR